jgi:hypothetical protein
MNGHVGRADLERLKVGVDGHELDPRNLGLDHAVDRVDTRATDADHPDDRAARSGGGRVVLRLLAPPARRLYDFRGRVGEDLL